MFGIHSPAEGFNPLPSCEGRQILFCCHLLPPLLQSTSLLRGKTREHILAHRIVHSFNPLPSCEGRLIILSALHRPLASIHFPLAREDVIKFNGESYRICFNPLPSCEGRPFTTDITFSFLRFNPLPSCEGRQIASGSRSGLIMLQSTSLLRGKTWIQHQ